MLPRNHPDRIQITFDEAWWPMPVCSFRPPWRGTSACPNSSGSASLGDAPGRANTSDKMMTLVASALAGGDCIDDADVLRTGGTAWGGTVKAPSTLGTFLAASGGATSVNSRVSRELLARAWQAGAGPGDGPLTIDLDSTICETYGLAKEGARHHGYTGKRGYHPLLAIAAGTGDVLMSRLREGRANTARGAAHFRGRRWDGCATSRYGPTAGSTLMTWYPSAARWMSASPSPSASTKACTISSRRYPKMPGRRFLRMDGAADVARPPAPPSRPRRTPRRYGSSSGG